MIDKVVCENCGQDLAFIESEKEIRLSDKAIIAVLGVTTDGEISGSLTCLNCGHVRVYNPSPSLLKRTRPSPLTERLH